jgi:hypothetical protein
MRLTVGEALWYHHDESTLPVRYVVFKVGISLVL